MTTQLLGLSSFSFCACQIQNMGLRESKHAIAASKYRPVEAETFL